MESKKINQLATAVNPSTSDLAIIGDPVTGVSKKITWLQVSTLIGTAANLQQVTDNGATTTNPVTIGGLTITGLSTGVLKSDSGVISSVPFGAANGVATLAGDGKVPSSQLPSYVDDVVEVANYAALPVTGETGKLYITLDNNKVYRWGGSVYVEVAANNGVWGSITGTLSNQTDLQNALNAKVPTSRTITINGTSYDLSADRTWSVGTLTSVGLTMPSGFSVASSPLTGAGGTIAVTGAGDSTQYIDGSGSLQTFPTLLSSDKLVKLVRNQSGATMTAGTIVYISGATGNKPLITKALATGDSTSAQTYGLVEASIANNADGYVVVIGNITDIDTSALTEGQQLYLSGTTAGAYTTTKPYAPIHLVYIGIVLRSHPTQGIIGVKIQNGYEMDELHNVDAQSPSNNDILSYNTSTSLWEHKQIATTLGFTPISLASLSAVSPLIYNNGTGAFSIQVATASQNGYLSSTDWSTFNNKQAALGGTGFVKISGSTISYDNSTYYLASNPSGYITLASLSAGAGISYSNITGVISSTITQYTDALARAAFSESVIGLDYSSSTGVLSTTTGYAIPTTAKQTEWDTAYTNRITSLTTTGSSGSATLLSNTLNVPTYTLSGLGGQPQLNGTGFVKASGTTISYDNSTYSLDSAVVHLAGTETITGIKTFTNYIYSSGAGGWALGGIAGTQRIEFYTSNFAFLTSANAYANILAASATFSSLVTINANLKQNGKIYNNFDWVKEVGFGYAGWTTLMLGTASASTLSLAFNVDLSGNTSPSFTGNGSEYFWRNAGTFKTPNAANNSYNTIMTWNSSGNVSFNYIVGGTWNGDVISDTYISSAATWNAKAADNAVVHLAGTETITGTKTFTTPFNATGSAVFNASGRATDYQYADMTNTGGRLIIGVDRSTGGAIVPGLSGSNTSIAYSSSFGTSANAWVHLFTSDQIRFNISPTGNVSINNTNNTYKFDVTGTTIFRGASIVEIGSVSTIGLLSESALDLSGGGYNGNVLQITYGYHSGTYAPVSSGMIVTSDTGATKGDYYVALRDSTTAGTAPTIKFRIAGNGNVSMGSSVGNTRNLNIQGSDTWISLKRTGGREYMIGTGLEDNFRIYDETAGTDRFKIDNTGVSTFYRNVNISSTYSYNVNGYAALRYSYWGYSSSYPVIVMGNASGNSGLCFNYDPINNTNGAFSGDGKEVLFRNGVRFATPNSANTGFHLNTMLFQDGSVIVGANAVVTGGGALQVNGNVNITGVFQINGTTIGGGSGSGVTGTGTTNYHTKWSSSSSITNSLLYDDGTRIGFNTTSIETAARFQINLSGGGTYGLFINKTTSDEATIRFKSTHDADSDYRIGASILIGSAWEIYSVNAAATRFAVLANGNTLIGGTTSVTGAGKLQVIGDVNITGNFKINGTTLSSGIGGSGTANYVPKFNASSTITNSSIYDNGTSVLINSTSAAGAKLIVNSSSDATYFKVMNSNTDNVFMVGVLGTAVSPFGYMSLQRGSVDKVYISAWETSYIGGGNLLIGTSTDVYNYAKLQVNGTMVQFNTYNRQTSSYTLVLSDAGKIVETNSSSANTITIPLNSSVAFAIGTEITIMQYGSGQTTINVASGVTLRSNLSYTKIGGQYTGVTLLKVGTNEWYIIGNLTA
jgi:hypothetical protein